MLAIVRAIIHAMMQAGMHAMMQVVVQIGDKVRSPQKWPAILNFTKMWCSIAIRQKTLMLLRHR